MIRLSKYKDVVLVLIITVLYHTMNQMFVPTLPLYITDLGGSEVVVGVIVGLLSLGSILAKVYFGRLSTRFSNLLVLRIGLVTATIVLFLYLPFLGFAFLGLVRLLQSIGLAGYVTGGQGVLSENTKPANRGLFFGIFTAMIGMGMMVGPLLGSFLADKYSYDHLFWGATLVVGLAAVLSFFMDGGAGVEVKAQADLGKDYKPHSPWKNRNLLVVSGAMLFAATVIGATSSMLALHARAVGIMNPSLFFVIFALTFTLGSSLSGYLSDRFGYNRLIIPGFCLLILGLMLLAVLNGLIILTVAAICAGLGLGGVNAVLLAMVPGYSVKEVDAGNDLAFFSNAFDLGVVFGSLGLSWLAARSFGVYWLAVAVLSGLGLLLYLKFNPETQHNKHSEKAQV